MFSEKPPLSPAGSGGERRERAAARVQQVASSRIGGCFSDDFFSANTLTFNQALKNRENELIGSYIGLGVYSGEAAVYYATKQAMIEYLDELELREYLISVNTAESLDDVSRALSALWSHHFVEDHVMNEQWHTVVRDVLNADISSVSPERVAAFDEVLEKVFMPSRSDVMRQIVEVDGGELYLEITNEMQDFSQVKVALQAWSIASLVHLPDILGRLDANRRKDNHRIIEHQLNEFEWSGDVKARLHSALRWLV